MLSYIARRLHYETGATHSGVAHAVALSYRRLHQLHHQANDVAWRAKLAVLPAGGHFAQDVLIHVAHSVAVFHIEVADLLHYAVQGFGTLDEEYGIGHISGVGRAAAVAQCLDKGEHEVAHAVEEILRA